MGYDPHANLIQVTVTVAPSTATAGTTLKISDADAAILDAAGLNPSVNGAFNATVEPTPAGSGTPSQLEIIRLTAKGASLTGNTQYTISRQAEAGGANRSILVGDIISIAITKKAITDIENAVTQKTVVTVGPNAGADYVTDGTADQVEINAAITAINAAGGGVIHLKPGTYNLAANVLFDSCSKILFEGEGRGNTIIKAVSNSVTDALHLSASSQIHIRHLELDGNKATYTGNYLITAAAGTTDCAFYDLYVHDSPKTNIQVIGSTSVRNRIFNNHIINAGISGVVLQDTVANKVEDNYLTGNAIRDIHVFYSAGSGRNNEISRNQCLSACSSWNIQSTVAESLIGGNIVENGLAGGIGASLLAVIAHNKLYNISGDDCIAIAGPSVVGGLIAGNEINGNSTTSLNGIFVGDGASGVTCVANTVTNCAIGGIRIWGATYSTFTGNTLLNNCTNTGGNTNYSEIWLGLSTFGGGSYPSNYNTISGNAIHTTLSPYGVNVRGQDFNTITNNTINGPTSAPISLGGAVNCVVSNNLSSDDLSKKTITIGTGINTPGLVINQNDTTNNPKGLQIFNTGTGISVDIQGKNIAGTPSNSAHLQIMSTDTMAGDKGGYLSLGGYSTGLTVQSGFAGIAGRKENGTDANTRGYLQIITTGAEVARFSSFGRLGIGITNPTAWLHLKAGVATASGAPLKLNSGVSLTTPEAGTMEFDGTNFYLTPVATRKTIGFADFSNVTNAVSFSMNSQSITSLADPTNAQDAATKNYVDATLQGLDIKASVKAATTGTLPTNTRSGSVLTATASGAFPTIDGVTINLNDRILVKDEATGANNGIYTLTNAGSVSTAWTLTRATDSDASAKVTAGMYTYVDQGTTNADAGFVLTTNDAITLNTTALTFTQFSGAGQISVGSGLTKSGNTLSLDATLVSLAAYNTNGILVQTAADTFTGRTITGTANQVTVTNGDGVSGNPTLSLPQSINTGATPTFAGLTLTGLSGVLKASTGVLAGSAVLNDLGAPSGDFSMNSHKLTSVTDPTAAQDAATKAYVDSVAQGLSVKGSVRLATAAALPTNTYSAGVITVTATGVLTVDGSTVALNDRILVKDEVTQANNGVYTCTTAGAVGVQAVLTRSADMDAAAEFPGAFVFVEAGTANAAAGFVCTNASNPTVGTTAITFTQFSGAGEITAGTGISKSGNTLSIGQSVATTADVTFAGATINGDGLSLNGNMLLTYSATAALVVRGGTSGGAVLQVDAAVTGNGIKIKATAGGASLATTSITTDDNLLLDAQGAGTIAIAGTSTGAVSVAKVTITRPATGSTLTIADGKTLTASNTLTLAGTDSTTMTFPGASDTLAGLATAQTFTKLQTITIASAANTKGLVINQNDTTNNPDALYISNTGTGNSLEIQAPNIALNTATSALLIMSTNSMAANLGGSIGLGGYMTGSTVQTIFAGIAGRKENGTDANSRGYLQIYSTGAEVARFTSHASLLLGTTTETTNGGINISGQAATGLTMVRETTASTAGNSLTITAGGAVSGGTNLAGGQLVLKAGIATGTAFSSIQTQTYAPVNASAVPLASGSTDGQAITRDIVGNYKALTNNSAINLINFTLASNTVIGAIIRYAVEVFNGTDLQLETGELMVQCGNKGGVFSGNTITQIGTAKQYFSAGAGSLAMTWAITGANPAVLSLNANSSLTPSTGYPRITYTVENFTQQAIAIQ